MEKLSEIVSAIDAALAATPLAAFYEDRKRMKCGRLWRGPLLLVSRGDDGPRAGYAYHKGGREELQFNVGFEDHGAYFRYGVAFSFETSQELPDPVAVLRPKVERFNRIVGRLKELESLQLSHYYRGSVHSTPVGSIPDTWVGRGAFVFLGERVRVPPGGVDDATIGRAAEVLASLLPLYRNVEGNEPIETSATQYRTARLCWNTDYWQRPTGRKGKSRNPKTFESQHGFGHEEWLFDCGNLIEGWKYGFVQAFNHSSGKYAGERLGLLLYSIDDESKRRYWVGAISELEVLTAVQAKRAMREIKRRGWMRVMCRQLESLGLTTDSLTEAGTFALVNVRFRPGALEVFYPPNPIPDGAMRATYYGTLQGVPPTQAAIFEGEEQRAILSERNLRTLNTTRYVYESFTEVDLVQTQWQLRLRETLVTDLPGAKARVEFPVDGHRLDAVIDVGGRRIFVELKTRGTARKSIRDALSQLLEYAYWPNARRCHALLVVGPASAGSDEREYLAMLRERFGLPVHYLQYCDGHIVGIGEWLKSLPDQSETGCAVDSLGW